MTKSTNPQENPNENCLDGFACPKCGCFGPFDIFVTKSGMTTVSDDGADDVEGDTEWDNDSDCKCTECGHSATVREFKGVSDVVPEFDVYQSVVAASFNGGDHCCQSPHQAKDCGNTLLIFLMAELSEREECNSFECGVRRLDSAIRQLTEVRSAFIQKSLD